MIQCNLRLLMLHSRFLPSAAYKVLPIDSKSLRRIFEAAGVVAHPCRANTDRLEPATAAAILWNVELATS